jgi:hypothetical protein
MVDDNPETSEQEGKSEERPPQHEVINVSSGDEGEIQKPPQITKEEFARLHIRKSKPPKLNDTPQLVTLKQRERNAIAVAVMEVQEEPVQPIECEQLEVDDIDSFQNIERLLGISEVATPASGNCMAMALAQAEADNSLADNDAALETITAALKRGICWTAQLYLNEQFNHYTRRATLISVERGWMGMSPQESNKQFRWYLHEYAETPSFRKAGVSKYNWGSSDLLATAANFLQREIFVLAFDEEETQQWFCSMYRPGTVTKGRKSYAAGAQVPLQLTRCLERIIKEKNKAKRPPIVLRYGGQHYTAFVHTEPKTAEVGGLPEVV